jgi:hypothetical protein
MFRLALMTSWQGSTGGSEALVEDEPFVAVAAPSRCDTEEVTPLSAGVYEDVESSSHTHLPVVTNC